MTISAEQTYNELKPIMMSEVQSAKAISVVDDTTYEIAVHAGLEISKRIKFVEEKFEEPKSAAAKAHRAICALEKEIIDPLKAAKSDISYKAGAYHSAKLRAAQEEEARRLAAARKAAEDAALKQAVELEKAGASEEAEAAIDNVPMPTAMPVVAAPKVQGVKQVTRWLYEITDATKIPRDFLIIDEQKLRKYAEAMKGSAKVEGVRFYAETKASFGGGR